MTKRIKLLLNWYELEGKCQIGEEEIPGLSIDDILKLFKEPFWNGVFQCWAIEAQHIAVLQPRINHTMQPHLYAYFLEATSINSQPP